MYTYSDTEACLYAGISEDTLNRYEKRNPQFRVRKNILRHTPNLHAKETLVKNIPGNLDQSRWWAKNAPLMREDYGEVTKLEHSGEIATSDPVTHQEDETLRLEYKERLKANIRKRAIENSKKKQKDENTK